MAETQQEFFSPDTLAEYLGIPVRTVYAWRSRGSGPRGYKIGKHVRFSRADVDTWLEQQADKAAA